MRQLPNWLNSLSGRLLLASMVLLPLFGLSGSVILQQAFEQSLLQAEKDKLRSQLYLLLGAADWQDSKLVMPVQLAEPRFSQINSGLAAWIVDDQGKVLWASGSTALIPRPAVNSTKHEPAQSLFQQIPLHDTPYFLYLYDVLWSDDKLGDIPLRFVLVQQQDTFLNTLQRYEQLLWRWIGGLTLLLLIVLWLIMRWGLAPLRQLAGDLQAIEQGQQQDLQGHYPNEVRPVVSNLNDLLKAERRQQQRYRDTLGDLAHSLKTPLTVVRGFLSHLTQPELKEQLDEQISRMDGIVQHQLQRAVREHGSPLSRTSTPVRPLLIRLRNTLDKVYADKAMLCDIEVDDSLRFSGSEGDLMELVGNLLDNAYKYGQHQVNVSASQTGDTLLLSIGDDGDGIDPSLRQKVLQRGERADTVTTGQGIGLAVTIDIISRYGGALEISQSALGGACFDLQLPAA